ncbi:VanW-like protein [Deinococcus aerius]|uniref:VanW-like protein n=1 Tax=Deinococcus aerius TaxID=200253 RepID=A0A2I9DKH9_9DEIO|nr:VanW family protein [Deinococcus aerius]GBF05381.1 VanW-like protein [Deinococcus aerius]
MASPLFRSFPLLPALLLGWQATAAAPGTLPLPTPVAPPAAVTRVTPPLRLQLRLSAPEPVLIGSRVERPSLERQFTLLVPGEQAARLRTSGDLSPLRAALDRVYTQVEARRARDVRFFREGNSWVARAQTGWKVDRKQTEARLREALGRGEGSSALVLRLRAPARSVRWAHGQGLTHLASGRSTFAGSPGFRVQNIRVGAGKLHGTWVAPGAEFNFNMRVGRIDAAGGFVRGYVITGRTLSLEDGGGLCQVSTTVFRAAHAAGLPITERHAHSYQVAYYDPPGLDAAVYAPSKNLRWRNDTAGPLLVQASWDLSRRELRIDLFGRPDGRKVWVAAPRQADVRPPPPPAFVADANLRPGETRRLDMPAPGSRVSVARQVRYADGRVVRDETRSVYRPWGGLFAVSPQDGRVR